MSDNQFRDFLRKQVLFEIKTKKMRQTLTEEQIGHIAHALILESDTLNEGLFSAIGSLLGGGVKKVKQFLSRRAVSYLGVSKRSPLYEPLTSFISSMPTKDIYFLYRGDTRHRERLVDILTDETVNILKRDMPDVLGLDTAGSLGGPVVDSVTRVVNTPGFKASIKRSFNDSFVRFANSEVADMSSIRQAISDLRGEVGGLSGDIQNLKTQFSARPSATTGAKMKDRKPTDPLDSDTDNDGLPDGEETELGTDPGKADTDGDGLPDGEEVTGQAAPGDEAEEAAEEAAEAAVEAEEAEAVGDEVAAEEAAEDAKEAAEKAEDAVEGASDVEAAEAAAEEARKKARKAEASKLRIPMRDFIKAKLNLDNDLGRYDPRISLEDLQAIHDNFLAAETDQQRLAAIETFARAKTFEELTKLIGAPDAEAPTPEPEEAAEVEEEPLTDEELKKVLNNTIRRYESWPGGTRGLIAIQNKRFLRDLEELATRLEGQEGYGEYPDLIKTFLNEKASGWARTRASEKLVAQGGIDKIIAKASEVLGVTQAAPEAEAEPEAAAPEAAEEPEGVVGPEAEAEPDEVSPEAPELETTLPPEIDILKVLQKTAVRPRSEEELRRELSEGGINVEEITLEPYKDSSMYDHDFWLLHKGGDTAWLIPNDSYYSNVAAIYEPEDGDRDPARHLEMFTRLAKVRYPFTGDQKEIIQKGILSNFGASLKPGPETTQAPEAVEQPEAEVVPEPADDAVDDGVPGEIPQEVRKKYKSLIARYNNPNISNEESDALEAEIEELENAYPGIDDEPEVAAEPAPEPEAEPESEPEPEAEPEEEPASELDADASVESTEAEAAEEAAEEARRKAEKERREAEKAQARAKEAKEAEKERERQKNAEAFRARKEKEQAAAEEEEGAEKTYRQVNVELYDDKTIVLSDRSARGKMKRPTIGEAKGRVGIGGSSEFSAHAGFGDKKFSRTGVSMVELPPISTDIVAKTNWTQDRKLKGPLTGVIKGFLRDSSDEAAKQFDAENLVIMPATTESGQQISGVIDHRKSKEIDFDYDYTSSNGISGKRIEKTFKDIISNVVFDGQVDEQRLRRYAKRLASNAFGRQPFIALIEYLADKELSTQNIPDDEDLAIDRISGTMTMDYIRTFIKDLGMAQVREKETEQDLADMEAEIEAEMEKQAKKKSKKVDEEVRIEEAFDITEEQLRRLLS